MHKIKKDSQNLNMSGDRKVTHLAKKLPPDSAKGGTNRKCDDLIGQKVDAAGDSGDFVIAEWQTRPAPGGNPGSGTSQRQSPRP